MSKIKILQLHSYAETQLPTPHFTIIKKKEEKLEIQKSDYSKGNNIVFF